MKSFFGWFAGWTANSADMINYLRSVPDSVDIISIWGAYQNLSPAQMGRFTLCTGCERNSCHIYYLCSQNSR